MEIRKYYADCSADIDDGALRNFRMNDIHDRNLMTDLDIEMQRKQGCFSRFPVRAMTDEALERRAEAFLDRYWPGRTTDRSRYEVREDRVYLMPEDCPDIRGLRFLRAGLYLGELKKNRFEPSQELALALAPNGHLRDDGIHVSIPSTDGRLGAFLRGEAIRPENPGKSGWRLVCADHWPVGWGKMAGGVLKNHIPEPWRSRQAAPAAAAARREIPIPGQDR